jgi:hypothetical protein
MPTIFRFELSYSTGFGLKKPYEKLGIRGL